MLYAIAEAYYRVRHEEGMGMGDVKMLGMIGAFLGWQLTIFTLVMASFAGAFAGLLLIALKRGDMKYALPFGTFLALGAALAATAGRHFSPGISACWASRDRRPPATRVRGRLWPCRSVTPETYALLGLTAIIGALAGA